jgi:intracellular septation protein A
MYFIRAFKPIVLDLISTIAFLGLFWLTGNFFVATGVAIAAAVARVGYLMLRGEPIKALLWLSVGLVIVLGTATLVTHDARFLMMKPTLVFFTIGIVMLTTNWLPPYLPEDVKEHVSERTLARVCKLWALAMFALGIANVAAALLLTPKIWSVYMGTVPTVVQIGAAAATYMLFRSIVDRGVRAKHATASAA